MRKRLGILAAAFFYYSGLIALSRRLMQRGKPRLIILNYHRASGGDLRRHLLYLRRHYRMLHLQEALEELYAPATARRRCSDRRTALALTFDDGYHDNYTHAFALARELGIPITIFLIPGYVTSGDYFWWTEGARLVRRATVCKVELEGRCYHLTRPGERALLAQAIDTRLRHATSVCERAQFLARMREELAVPAVVRPEEQGDLPLTWAEVRKMQESGWVSFGAHTMHHPVLAYLADPEEVRHEVSACRHVMEGELGCCVSTFAYPVGRAEHVGEAAVRAVREAGYKWAVTTMHGVNTPASDPYLLGRVLGDVSRHWLVMAAETSGIWQIFSPLWKAIVGKGESA